jgi:hypothetical protein
LTRWCVIVSMGFTAALVPLGHLVGVGRPPMYFLIFLVLLGVPYLAVPHQQVLRTPLPMWQRLLMLWPLTLALAIAAEMIRLASARMVVGEGAAAFYRADFSPVGGGIAYIAWIVTGALVISLGCILTGHRMLGGSSLLPLPPLAGGVGRWPPLLVLTFTLGLQPGCNSDGLGLDRSSAHRTTCSAMGPVVAGRHIATTDTEATSRAIRSVGEQDVGPSSSAILWILRFQGVQLPHVS